MICQTVVDLFLFIDQGSISSTFYGQILETEDFQLILLAYSVK
jgi:hypothetical protein